MNPVMKSKELSKFNIIEKESFVERDRNKISRLGVKNSKQQIVKFFTLMATENHIKFYEF